MQDPEGRQALASALFAKLEVEGYQKMTYELTPDAVDLGLQHGLTRGTSDPIRSVGLVGARGFEPPTSASRTLRAAKLRHAPTEEPAATRACGDCGV